MSGFDLMEAVASGFEGQLTATLHTDQGDTAQTQRLIPVLERKAASLLVNGFPTGVEVADAKMHGGLYPASTDFDATSVRTLSIRGFLRPVCCQDFPDSFLPLTPV